MRRSICFLSMDDLGDYVSDDELAIEPLKDLGWNVETLSWKQTARRWSDFEAVIIRTPWDYHESPAAFLDALRSIAGQTRLENPLDIVQWNLNKRYLEEMRERGVDIVPTIWADHFDAEAFARWKADLVADEVVVKPTVSATARNTFRVTKYDSSIASIFDGVEFMVQPFIPEIVEKGEYSLFYFSGEYSHAIVKRPKTGDFRVQEEHGGLISSVEPGDELRRAADKIVEKIGKTLLYARVDLVTRDNDHSLMELELIEPSLYLRTHPDAPANFANAVDRFLQ